MNWLKKISDGWENVVTQLGTTYDKLQYHRAYSDTWYTCEELEALFYGDAFARCIIAEPVDAAFRQGYEIISNSEKDAELLKDDIDLLKDLIFELDVEAKLQEAIYWGRLYGRGGLLLGINDGGTLATQLEPERIREVEFFEALTCDNFIPSTYYEDGPKYGEPLLYQVQRDSGGSSSSEIVHESRIILTRGVPTSKRKRLENDWRDASVIQAVYPYLRNWDSANAGAAHMLTDSSQAVLSIRQFASMLGSTDISIFTNRMRILELARSLRIMPIDAENESFEYVERAFSGVADLMDRAAFALAGAARMPQTILFGRSPAGLNATGESDIRGWYDNVGSERSKSYQPILERIIYYLAVAQGLSEPESWGISWNSLWQETEKEKAETNKIIAETDNTYINAGVLSEEEVAQSRFSGEEFSRGVVQLDLEMREVLRAQNAERAKDPNAFVSQNPEEDLEIDPRGDPSRPSPDDGESGED